MDIQAYGEIHGNGEKLDDPYFFCLFDCISFILGNYGFDASERIAICLDRNDDFWGETVRMYDELGFSAIDGHERIEPLGFGDMRKYPGLQAADVLAWESNRYATNVIKKQGSPSKSLRELADHVSHNHVFWGREELQKRASQDGWRPK